MCRMNCSEMLSSMLAGNWTLLSVTRATAMPSNTCDDRIVSIERGGVELVFSWWSHVCQAAGR